MELYGSMRDKTIAAGYLPLPIDPKTKSPAVKGWRESNYIPPGGWVNNSLGVITGDITAVDIDVQDATLSTAVQGFVSDLCGETICRVGKAPKALLVYRSAVSGRFKRVSRAFYDSEGKKHQVEFLRDGQQFVAYGPHPSGKNYEWVGILGGLVDVPLTELATIDDEQIGKIISFFESRAEAVGMTAKKAEETKVESDFDAEDPLSFKPKIGATLEQVKEMLASLDPNISRED